MFVSSAFSLPFFFHKMSSRRFDELLERMFQLHPGLKTKGIEARMLIGYFAVASGVDPGDEALRLALALKETMVAEGFEDDVLSSRLEWFVRDYIAVGSVLAEGEDGAVCEVRHNSKTVGVSPYVFGVLLTAFLREGVIDGEDASAAASQRRLSIHEELPLEASLAITKLLDGSADYRVSSTSSEAGKQEFEQLRSVQELVAIF